MYRKDKGTTGIITYLQDDDNSRLLTVRGKFLETILKESVISQTQSYNGTAEEVCRRIVNDNCINPSDKKRVIPRLQLGESKGLGGKINIQRTLKPVYDVLNEILTEQELSFKIRYDISNEIMLFEVYNGIDRTTEQIINDRCVFSKELYNVYNETYTESTDSRNVAYVGGEGEGSERVFITVDLSKGELRKELAVDARDLRKTEGMSESAYEELLINRGKEKLAEWNITKNVEFEIDSNNVMTHDLGDKCTYVLPKYGIIMHDRITEIWESYENNNMKVKEIFGNGILSLGQTIKRGGLINYVRNYSRRYFSNARRKLYGRNRSKRR